MMVDERCTREQYMAMNDMQARIERVRQKVKSADRRIWRQMDEAGIASLSYLRYVVEGKYNDYGALKLEAIERFIDKAKKAAA